LVADAVVAVVDAAAAAAGVVVVVAEADCSPHLVLAGAESGIGDSCALAQVALQSYLDHRIE